MNTKFSMRGLLMFSKSVMMVGLLVVTMGAGLTGCASREELPPQMTQSLGELRDLVVQGKAQLQVVCNAARDVTQRPQAQLQPQIDRLVKSINTLENTATDNRKQFATADEHAQAYFSHWTQQMQGMSESLSKSGQERHDKSVASFDELKIRAEALKKEFRPFMASLQEVSKYLSTDTTAAGVKAVTPQVKLALDKENSLMQKADAIISQIDAMRGGK